MLLSLPWGVMLISPMRSTAVLLILALALSGCAESVLIKSYPGGAKAYIDGVVIGTTPARTQIPRSQVGEPHTWRVEFRNCDSAEGQLETGIGGGRIVGYIFTLGLSALAKGPRYYLPVDAVLTGGDCEPAGSGASQQPGIMIQNIIGDKNQVPAGQGLSKTQRLAERLTTLRDLYNRKLIAQQVYEQESQKAVKEFGD
jgi:PEGA domain